MKKLNEKEIGMNIGELWRGHLDIIKPVIRLITPQEKNSKRYDCIFYTVNQKVKSINIRALHKGLNHENIKELFINEESVSYDWKNPSGFLQDYINKKITLFPPQLMILGGLMGMQNPQQQLMQLDQENCLTPLYF